MGPISNTMDQIKHSIIFPIFIKCNQLIFGNKQSYTTDLGNLESDNLAFLVCFRHQTSEVSADAIAERYFSRISVLEKQS